MSLHTFDPEIAARVGVNAAVIYQNIVFWTRKNAANNRHIHDGLVWTYNSRAAFLHLFPYLTDSQIKTAFSKLIGAGLVAKGEFNAVKYDRTNWYAATESASWINQSSSQISPDDWSEIANGADKNSQPIPDSKPNINTDTPFIAPPEPKPKKRRRKPEVELPEGWVPSDKNIEDAQSKGLSQEEIDHEADKFRNHHHSKQSLFRDWDAAWRTWVANAIKFRKKGSSADSSSRQISFAARAGRSPREDCF